MADDAKRRIVDVDVKEVSLVDRAANLRQFLVVKRLSEDSSMGAFKERSSSMSDVKKAEMEEEEKKKAAKEKEEEEKRKAAMTDEEKAKAAADEEKRKAAEKEKEEREKLKKGGMNPKAVAGILQGLKGAPKDAVDKLVEFLATQKAEEGEGEEEGAGGGEGDEEATSKLLKSLSGVQMAVMEDGSVFVGGQPVIKSKKFTESRTNTLKDVALQLMKLIGDVDPTAAKSFSEAVKELPDGKVPGSEVKPVATTKSAEVEELQKTVAELTKSLKAITETRQTTKSAEGGTDDKEKVEKSIWGGVL